MSSDWTYKKRKTRKKKENTSLQNCLEKSGWKFESELRRNETDKNLFFWVKQWRKYMSDELWHNFCLLFVCWDKQWNKLGLTWHSSNLSVIMYSTIHILLQSSPRTIHKHYNIHTPTHMDLCSPIKKCPIENWILYCFV